MDYPQKLVKVLSGKQIAAGFAGLTFGLLSVTAQAVTVTDVAGRTVTVPDDVQRVVLGEGRLFFALSLLEGQKPFDRIVGWQGDFRKLDPQTYATYRAKFPQIDNIPLIGTTSADTISPEKVLTLNPQLAIFGLSGHGPGKGSELVKQLQNAGVPVVFVDFRTSPLKNTLPSMELLGKVLNREKQAQEYIRFYQGILNASPMSPAISRCRINRKSLSNCGPPQQMNVAAQPVTATWVILSIWRVA